MKTEKKSFTHRLSEALIWCGLIALALLSYVYVSASTTAANTAKAVERAEQIEAGILPLCSEYEMRLFAQDTVQPIVNALLKGTYPDRQIQALCEAAHTEVRLKHGEVRLQYAYMYSVSGRQILASSNIREGIPSIIIYIPTAIDYMELIQRTPRKNWRFATENAVVVAFMHELDHLILDNGLPSTPTREKFLEAEIRAWAVTSDHALEIMIDKKRDLPDDLVATYFTWLFSHRNINDPQWVSHIRELYRN